MLRARGGLGQGVTLRRGKKEQLHISEEEPQEARVDVASSPTGALQGDPVQGEKGPQFSSTARVVHEEPLPGPLPALPN